MYGQYGHYEFPPIFTTFFNDETTERKNCRKIGERLEKCKIAHKDVSRHNLFSQDYYLIDLGVNSPITEEDIAKALDIPLFWIDFYSYPGRYAILEEKINKKHCDSNGVLCFNDFNILEHWNVCDTEDIEEALNNYRNFSGNKVSVYEDFILIIGSHCSSEIIASRLNIPDDAVTDISLEDTNIKHIIIKSKIPKGGC